LSLVKWRAFSSPLITTTVGTDQTKDGITI
jgi:hypothetical protein